MTWEPYEGAHVEREHTGWIGHVVFVVGTTACVRWTVIDGEKVDVSSTEWCGFSQLSPADVVERLAGLMESA